MFALKGDTAPEDDTTTADDDRADNEMLRSPHLFNGLIPEKSPLFDSLPDGWDTEVIKTPAGKKKLLAALLAEVAGELRQWAEGAWYEQPGPITKEMENGFKDGIVKMTRPESKIY